LFFDEDENVLIDQTNLEVKLLDFGATSATSEVKALPFYGTLAYAAPEVVSLMKTSDQNSVYLESKQTVWTLGHLLWNMLYYRPMKTNVTDELAFIKENYPDRIFSEEAEHLVRKMLDPNFETRIDLMDLNNDHFLAGMNTVVVVPIETSAETSVTDGSIANTFACISNNSSVNIAEDIKADLVVPEEFKKETENVLSY
jgi:serine/threonine protein kinase